MKELFCKIVINKNVIKTLDDIRRRVYFVASYRSADVRENFCKDFNETLF